MDNQALPRRTELHGKNLLPLMLLLLVGLRTRDAQAQANPHSSDPTPTGIAASSTTRASKGMLQNHFGIAVSDRLLASADDDDEVRAVERLVSIGTAQAIERLARASEPGGPVWRNLHARLAMVRGLAPYAAQEDARSLVLRVLEEGAASTGGHYAELGPLLRDTAALVLARSHDPVACERLAAQARQGGDAGAAAQRALVAYPPKQLSGVILPHTPPSLATVELLESLGDLRTLPYLRQAVRQGDPAVRAASLVALARLGDGEAAAVAHEWSRVADPRARLAAAQVLVLLSAHEGRTLVASLLHDPDPTTRDEALKIAAVAPGPELEAPLIALLREGSLDALTKESAIAALGRSAGAPGVLLLDSFLDRPGEAPLAGMALAVAPGDTPRHALEEALGKRQTVMARAAALRAATLRSLVLDDEPKGLRDAVRAASHESDSALRAAAAFAEIALGWRDVDDPELIRQTSLLPAVARAALVQGQGALEKLLGVLTNEIGASTKEMDRVRRDALGIGLIARPDAGLIPSRTLLTWVEEAGALAPLAARALAARDDASERASLNAWALSPDPQLRAHVAMGLRYSLNEDAAGRLAQVYAFETDPRVRAAIVRSLGARTEPIRKRTLELAAAFDPNATVRSLARLVLRGEGIASAESTAGDLAEWVHVVSTDPAATPVMSSFRWERPDGLVLPVVPDPDGTLLVPGLRPGKSHVNLAPGTFSTRML